MVIVSLVAAGVGRAIDAYTERKARREERRCSSDGQTDEEINTASQDADKMRQEQEAFSELQNYADFQSDLSTKVLNDLSRGDVSMVYNGPSEPRKRPIIYKTRHPTSSHNVHSGRLAWPIIIPRADTQNGNGCWARAYPRPLIECGIDQDTFLNFLDSFDVHMRLSTRVEAANIANASAGIGWRDSSENFSRAIPAAVQIMKAYQKDRKSNSFLNHVNALNFRPRGLFAMVITSRPDSPLQVINVDVTQLKSAQQFDHNIQMPTEDDLSTPLEAVSMVDDFQPGSSKQSNHQAEESMDIDFLQRKRYFEKIPTMHAPRTKLFQIPAESGFSSSSNRGPLSGILSSVAKQRERRSEAVNKKIRRDRRFSSRSSAAIASAVMGASSSSGKGQTQTGKLNEEKMKTDNDVLYLVIVNDLENEASQFRDMEFDSYPTKSTMMPSQASTSNSPWASFHDPFYSKSSGAPPAYSEKQS